MVDYYSALELSKTATTQEIKQAYRKLALRWHPDKNLDKKEEAEKRFKEINEAYEVLSDEKKRKIYDQYGKEGLDGGGGKRMRRHYHGRNTDSAFDHDFSPFFQFSFRNPEDVFREFFGGDPFTDFFVQSAPMHAHNGNSSLRTRNPFQSPGFGFAGGFPFMFPDAMQTGFPDFTTSFNATVSTGGTNPSVGVRKTSTSTRFVNGKKIETKKVLANGVETVTVHEDGVLKSRTVNGVQQQVQAIR
ncbi:hypothetical protein JTE90_022717 [Oedothorax gibbosus]|uniref:J domain-containing protein n=1 Tax=Oedothorax gibbosus TaxID=931172 RepID=A0AAV6UR71_9ARAC|nr:hypothetical protein JTE90_022717 [Oedothorax gibbosus]